MAVIADPQGAFFMIWEPGRHFGAALVNSPGALCWNELASPDPQASADFYGALFGWELKPMDGVPDDVLRDHERRAEQRWHHRVPPAPRRTGSSTSRPEEIDAGIAKVEELSGTKLSGPHDLGIAKFAVLADPQGASFALTPASSTTTPTSPGPCGAQAACGRYARQDGGITGLETWMKISGCGARGARRGCMPACAAVRSALRRLHGATR